MLSGRTKNTKKSRPLPSKEIEDFWKIELIGITDKQTDPDDIIAMNKFDEKVRFKDKIYEVVGHGNKMTQKYRKIVNWQWED
ncbi:hypothetical protein DPMN_030179 [Dreissena polymorpha]|uniref:Uncharacterized protein n=1 Tax=Dreissena polymorpha TaxID=45954 RepID=A0A9D4M0E1_DREPO|nr:hypothetical protein DPMN_030179 [Dreissena polymorpha]